MRTYEIADWRATAVAIKAMLWDAGDGDTVLVPSPCTVERVERILRGMNREAVVVRIAPVLPSRDPNRS